MAICTDLCGCMMHAAQHPSMCHTYCALATASSTCASANMQQIGTEFATANTIMPSSTPPQFITAGCLKRKDPGVDLQHSLLHECPNMTAT